VVSKREDVLRALWSTLEWGSEESNALASAIEALHPPREDAPDGVERRWTRNAIEVLAAPLTGYCSSGCPHFVDSDTNRFSCRRYGRLHVVRIDEDRDGIPRHKHCVSADAGQA
jgi:hypothetical protein